MLKFGSKQDSNIVYKCTVRLLKDPEIIESEYKPYHKGKYLREYVCQQLNLVEQDYLGLRYMDAQYQRHWLDLEKSICKQVKDVDPVLFSFRVKFYPPNPFRLREKTTRYQIFLQLKRDLLHGRLYCDTNEAAMLVALILQAEVGDFDPEIHYGNYVSDFNILLKQTEAIENKAMEIHREQLKSQSQSQVEHIFLKLACQLDTYGVDPHPVKALLENHKGTQLYLGINYRGILAFHGSKKSHHFRWADIQKLRYDGKIFIMRLNYNHKRHTVGFKCPSEAACRYTWRCGIEQMLFFTSVVTARGLFSWGTKFKYTGRTEQEIFEDTGSPSRAKPNNQRSSNDRRGAPSVPATSSPFQPHLDYVSLSRCSHTQIDGSHMESRTDLLSGVDNHSEAYIDALEIVPKDQETIGVMEPRSVVLKDSIDRDYYFRNSVKHPSSESKLMDDNYRRYDTTNSTHHSSRSQTALSRVQADGRLNLANTTHNIQNDTTKCNQFTVIDAFVPILVVLAIFVLIAAAMPYLKIKEQ